MAIIKTGSLSKALWPGVKAAWEAAYEDYPAKNTYYHCKIHDKVDTEEEANLYVEILNDAIDLLVVDNPVYVRVPPKVYKEKDFDTATTQIYVGCRFSVGDPKIVGKVGKIVSDDYKLVTGFGLAPVKKEGTYEHVNYGLGYTITKDIINEE